MNSDVTAVTLGDHDHLAFLSIAFHETMPECLEVRIFIALLMWFYGTYVPWLQQLLPGLRPTEDLVLRGIWLDATEPNLNNKQVTSKQAKKGLVFRMLSKHSEMTRGQKDGRSYLWPGRVIGGLDGSATEYKNAGLNLVKVIKHARNIILDLGSAVLEVRSRCIMLKLRS